VLIKKLGKNNLGRDFVCGDIHGAYSCIMRFLQEIDFDFEKDRFFAVGDLIDRGPESLKCLKLLKEPWFFSVLGNHEIFMYEYYKMVNDDTTADPMCYYWPRNGGMWGVDLINNDELNEVPELMKLVSELPTLISVDYGDNKRFHIIHAEVKPVNDDLPFLEEDFEEGKFQQIAFQRNEDGPFVYWGRDVFNSLYGIPMLKIIILEELSMLHYVK
jgi:serine/threonine protein phosphatase 1